MASVFHDLAESRKAFPRIPTRGVKRQEIVNAFQEAFELIGGVPRLAVWAHDNPTDFYKLYGKLLPAGSTLDVNVTGQLFLRPALPPSPLDGEFTDAEFAGECEDDPVRAAASVYPLPSAENALRRDGGA